MEDKLSRTKHSKNISWSFIPWILLQNIGFYLELNDIFKCNLTCKNWYLCFAQSSTPMWKFHCRRLVSEEALLSDVLCQFTSWKSKLKAYCNAWDGEDCSKNIYVKKDGFTLHRKPVARSTDGIRGKMGFSSGRHCWEIWWLGPLGTVAVVGIATRQASLHYQGGYISLLGKDENSWGWNLVDNVLYHGGKSEKLSESHVKYKVGDRLRMILDCDERLLSFEKSIDLNGLGESEHNFSKLDFSFANVWSNGKSLYPAVSAVYGHSEVCIVYLGTPVDG